MGKIFVRGLFTLYFLISLGCIGCNSSGGSKNSSSSSGNNDDSVQQNNVNDPNAIYFSDSDELSFSGGVDGTAVRAFATFSQVSMNVILNGTHCEIVKIDLLDSERRFVRMLTSGTSRAIDCDMSSSSYMKNARIAVEKGLNPNENIVPFFNSNEGSLYLYMPENATNLNEGSNLIRIYGGMGAMNYLTRNIGSGVDGTVGTQASLYFDIRSGLPANATDKIISIDGVSIDLGVGALSGKDIAQKIAAVDFTGGRIYEDVPYEVRAQGSRVTFRVKLSGDNSNGRTLVIEDNQYTQD